ncbi:MAG: hypothetical protein AB7G21_04970 [Dehalococcoidia bacterium]
MAPRTRSITGRLLLRAWIEPAHERPLRVVISRHDEQGEVVEEQAFTDVRTASACVRTWLSAFVRRWERGEQPDGHREE